MNNLHCATYEQPYTYFCRSLIHAVLAFVILLLNFSLSEFSVTQCNSLRNLQQILMKNKAISVYV